MLNPVPFDQMRAQARILIVDDSKTERAILDRIFRKAGFETIAQAADGKEGLQALSEFSPTLVLLDINMPRMDGIAMLQALPHAPDEPAIIMQTAHNETALKQKAFAAGATDYITKPYDPSEVIARAVAHLERRQLRQEARANYDRIREEISEATLLHRLLLPSDMELRRIGAAQGFDIGHYSQTASELGGDYMLVRQIAPDKTLVVMADIAGHGMTSALYAYALHTIFLDTALHSLSPDQALSDINRRLRALMVPGKFATMFYGVIDSTMHTLTYAGAASPKPLLLRQGNAYWLNTRGVPLGAVAHSSYTEHRTVLKPEDVLFLYSDAIVEGRNANGHVFSERRLAELIGRHAPEGSNICLRRLLDAFFSERDQVPADDLTLMLLRF